MRAQGGWRTQLAHSLRSLARFRLRGPRSFAPAPGAPVSQASGLLLVLLDQDYQANTSPGAPRLVCSSSSTCPTQNFILYAVPTSLVGTCSHKLCGNAFHNYACGNIRQHWSCNKYFIPQSPNVAPLAAGGQLASMLNLACLNRLLDRKWNLACWMFPQA